MILLSPIWLVKWSEIYETQTVLIHIFDIWNLTWYVFSSDKSDLSWPLLSRPAPFSQWPGRSVIIFGETGEIRNGTAALQGLRGHKWHRVTSAGQSEDSIEVTWYVSPNQRPVIRRWVKELYKTGLEPASKEDWNKITSKFLKSTLERFLFNTTTYLCIEKYILFQYMTRTFYHQSSYYIISINLKLLLLLALSV